MVQAPRPSSGNPTARKHVLLVLNDYRRGIHDAIIAQSQISGWSLEFSRLGIPFGWSGDGAIIDRLSADEVKRLRRSAAFPICTLTDVKGVRIGKILGDARAIAAIGLAFLERRGFTRFIVLDVGLWPIDPCGEFCAQAAARGHQVEHVLASPDKMDFAGQVALVAGRLQEAQASVGMFLGGSHLCSLAVHACRSAGLRIPEDIAIITNDDDQPLCEAMRPTITAINGESRKIGSLLAQTLAKMMADPGFDGGRTIVRPDLVIERESTNALVISDASTMRAIRHMMANYARISGIEEVARVAGMTSATLRQRFLHYVKRHPKEYLIDIRMQEALHLLKSTDSTLEEIAARIGYSCAMSFYSAFKRIYGKTPGDYRQEYRKSA